MILRIVAYSSELILWRFKRASKAAPGDSEMGSARSSLEVSAGFVGMSLIGDLVTTAKLLIRQMTPEKPAKLPARLHFDPSTCQSRVRDGA